MCRIKITVNFVEVSLLREYLTLCVFFSASSAKGDEKIELVEMGTGGGVQETEEGKKLEDAGTQKEHVPGVDEVDNIEVRKQELGHSPPYESLPPLLNLYRSGFLFFFFSATGPLV